MARFRWDQKTICLPPSTTAIPHFCQSKAPRWYHRRGMISPHYKHPFLESDKKWFTTRDKIIFKAWNVFCRDKKGSEDETNVKSKICFLLPGGECLSVLCYCHLISQMTLCVRSGKQGVHPHTSRCQIRNWQSHSSSCGRKICARIVSAVRKVWCFFVFTDGMFVVLGVSHAQNIYSSMYTTCLADRYQDTKISGFVYFIFYSVMDNCTLSKYSE